MHATLRNTRTMIIALLAISVFGCAPDMMRPEGATSRSSVGMGTAFVPGDTVGVPAVEPKDPLEVKSPRDSTIEVSELVSSTRASIMNAGCMRLEIPAGAIRGDATIEMKAAASGRHVVLEIKPSNLNGFDIPVRLSTDCSGVQENILRNLAFFWIDPVTGDWVLVENSTVDMRTGEVSAELQHFSEYRIGNRNLGKAGW